MRGSTRATLLRSTADAWSASGDTTSWSRARASGLLRSGQNALDEPWVVTVDADEDVTEAAASKGRPLTLKVNSSVKSRPDSAAVKPSPNQALKPPAPSLMAATGVLRAMVPDSDWQAREPARADLQGNHHGSGRELFGGMRRMVSGAEQGATTFGFED